MQMRVVGFEFTEPSVSAGLGLASRRVSCPVSPLGDLLQQHDISSDELSRAGTDSDGYGSGHHYDHYEGEDYSMGSHSHSWGHHGYVPSRAQDGLGVPQDFTDDMRHARPVPPAQPVAVAFEVVESTCSTYSSPIPIPEPKPKTPEPEEQPKLVKRVPEPPMVRAVTAPAVVEEVYAEYERVRKAIQEEELYQQMLAAQGQKPTRRRTIADAHPGMDLGTEMDKLSWRTVYTHMQSDTLPLRRVTSTLAYCR